VSFTDGAVSALRNALFVSLLSTPISLSTVAAVLFSSSSLFNWGTGSHFLFVLLIALFSSVTPLVS